MKLENLKKCKELIRTLDKIEFVLDKEHMDDTETVFVSFCGGTITTFTDYNLAFDTKKLLENYKERIERELGLL